jgi:hypothetical protein
MKKRHVPRIPNADPVRPVCGPGQAMDTAFRPAFQ